MPLHWQVCVTTECHTAAVWTLLVRSISFTPLEHRCRPPLRVADANHPLQAGGSPSASLLSSCFRGFRSRRTHSARSVHPSIVNRPRQRVKIKSGVCLRHFAYSADYRLRSTKRKTAKPPIQPKHPQPARHTETTSIYRSILVQNCQDDGVSPPREAHDCSLPPLLSRWSPPHGVRTEILFAVTVLGNRHPEEFLQQRKRDIIRDHPNLTVDKCDKKSARIVPRDPFALCIVDHALRQIGNIEVSARFHPMVAAVANFNHQNEISWQFAELAFHAIFKGRVSSGDRHETSDLPPSVWINERHRATEIVSVRPIVIDAVVRAVPRLFMDRLRALPVEANLNRVTKVNATRHQPPTTKRMAVLVKLDCRRKGITKVISKVQIADKPIEVIRCLSSLAISIGFRQAPLAHCDQDKNRKCKGCPRIMRSFPVHRIDSADLKRLLLRTEVQKRWTMA